MRVPMIDSLSSSKSSSWLVVWTESRAEKKVVSRASAQGIECWLPATTQRHRWSDRWKEVVLPLFPGYLFVRNDASVLTRLLRTPGVLSVVKAGDKPALLSEGYIASLRQAVESAHLAAEPVENVHEYNTNDEIIVQEGPLAGLRGVVRQLRGASQLVVWIAEIGRGVAFTINSKFVAPGSTGA